MIDRLAEHRTLQGTPRSELAWLLAHGEFRSYPAGTVLVAKSELTAEMFVLLTGSVAVHFGHGTGRIHNLETSAGELAGFLPFSRMVRPPGDAVAVGQTDVFVVHRDHFSELVRECPVITGKLVHAMIDRARMAAAMVWQDEKMMSLGRLAAGLAHELNNPSAAAVRGAKHLGAAMVDVGAAAYALGRERLSEAQFAQVQQLMVDCMQGTGTQRLAPLALLDREDQITEWLEARGADASPASALASANVTIEVLESLVSTLPPTAVEPALRWIAASCAAHSNAMDVEGASIRVVDLIDRLKRFTNMDRTAAPHPIDVAQGLADTVAVLAGRAAARGVTIRLELADDLPRVVAHAADLNQLWSNLLENAVDAARPGGEVVVRARIESRGVAVRVIDDGAGIPSEVLARIFDPFYTTKGVGQGMGMGLDIVRRIVHMHDGEIEVDPRAGRTEFCVLLPTTGGREGTRP